MGLTPTPAIKWHDPSFAKIEESEDMRFKYSLVCKWSLRPPLSDASVRAAYVGRQGTTAMSRADFKVWIMIVGPIESQM